jgi:hypothetical protein
VQTIWRPRCEDALAWMPLGKSGDMRPILDYDSRELLWQLYRQVYPDIQARASSDGLSLHDSPRSSST